MKKLTIEQRDWILSNMNEWKSQYCDSDEYNDAKEDCIYKLKKILNANTEESNDDRTFSGEFEPETVLAELTQFNKDGNKIAHFVYTLPDLNPKQESKLKQTQEEARICHSYGISGNCGEDCPAYGSLEECYGEQESKLCPECGGTGEVDSGEIPKGGVKFMEICPKCKGNGEVERE